MNCQQTLAANKILLKVGTLNHTKHLIPQILVFSRNEMAPLLARSCRHLMVYIPFFFAVAFLAGTQSVAGC